MELVLSSSGNDCQHAVVTLRGNPEAASPLRQAGISVYRADPRGGRRAAIRDVRQSINLFRPDLVHTSLFEADLAGRVAALRAHVPVLTSLVNTPYAAEAVAAEVAPQWKLRQVRLLDQLLAKYATTAFHAISDATADHAVTYLKVDPAYIRVIPRGRRPSALGERTQERRIRIRRMFGWGNRPIIINVARQEPQKGQLFLIEAMKAVLREKPNALLVLVGRQGRSTLDIEEAIIDCGIEGSVLQLGERTDVPDLLAAADLFVFSSLYEGLGGAVVEASGLGLPVVAFNIPAVREVVGPANPWLVPIRNVSALSRAVLEALTCEPDMLAEISRAQQDRFSARFEITAVVDATLRLYRDILNPPVTVPRWTVRATRVPVAENRVLRHPT
jgi:glycosyltransferase involved in cell wall biosynthesis